MDYENIHTGAWHIPNNHLGLGRVVSQRLMFLGVAVAGDFCGFFLRSLSQSRIDYSNIDERVFFWLYIIQKKSKRIVNLLDCVVF